MNPGTARWTSAAALGFLLWSGAAGAADDDATGLEQYRRANVLPAEEIAPVAPEVRAAHLAALAVFDEAVASKDPKHPGYKKAREVWEPLAAAGDPRFDLSLRHAPLLRARRSLVRPVGSGPDDREGGGAPLPGGPRPSWALLAEQGDGLVVAAGQELALEWYTHGALGGHCAAVRRLVRAYEQAELGVAADAGKADEWRARLDGCRKR